MGKKIAIALGVIAVVLALVVCLVPLKTMAYTVTVDYQDTETYYEDVPYEEMETYTEAELLDYQVLNSHIEIEEENPIGYVGVQNVDNVSGTFNVLISFMIPYTSISPGRIVLGTKIYEGNDTLYLKANETKIAKYHAYDAKANSEMTWHYEVTPSTKEVERERTITKYRQVEKQRTVTKQRPETHYKKVTLLDYWLDF